MGERFDRVFEIMGIYVKYLLGMPVTTYEENVFQHYSQDSIFNTSIRLDLRSDQYLDETDFSMGDLILTFKNPDAIAFEVIGYQEAMKFFEEGIASTMAIQFKNEQLDSGILRFAFQQAYDKLLDSDKEDKTYREQETEQLEAIFAQIFKGKKKSGTERQWSKPDNDWVDKVIHSTRDNILYNINRSSKRKTQQKDKKVNKKQKELKLDAKKKFYSKGYYLKQEQIDEQSKWVSTNQYVQDFLTLARHLILLRLSQKGFKIRTFLSRTGKYLYAVLYSAEDNLKVVAETIKMSKFLNIEFTDLLSLEPVDSNYRPLRLNNRLWRPLHEYKTTDYFKYLRPKILDLLEKINFKRMAKEVNIQALNEQMFSNGRDDILQDDEGPLDSVWEAYYEYLVTLHIKVKQARELFYFKQDFAVLLNPSRIHNKRILQRNPKLLLERLRERYKRKLRKGLKNELQDQHIVNETMSLELEQILQTKLLIVLEQLKIQCNRYETAVDLIRKISLHFDAEPLCFVDMQSHNDPILGQVIHLLPLYIKQQTSKQVSDFSRSFSIGKELQHDYIVSLKYHLLEDMFARLMRNEIEQWMLTIEQETEQFPNLKEVMQVHTDFVCTKFLKEKLREGLAQSYGQALRESIEIVNYGKKGMLRSMWDFDVLKNIELSSEYFGSNHKIQFRKKCKINTIWKKYRISESGRISSFSMMERIKLVDAIVQGCINVPYLMNSGYLEQMFALNDVYELTDQSNKQFFEEKIVPLKQTNRRLSYIDRSPDVVDRINSEQSQLLHSQQSQQTQILSQEFFVQNKLHNLGDIWRMQLGAPWYVPSVEIRNYYGEKIALYFSYLGHYTQSLLVPGILGLISTIIQSTATAEVSIMTGIIYGMYHTTFLNTMFSQWQRKEKSLAAKFGQHTKLSDQAAERPAFVGDYRRDPVNDSMNTQYFPFHRLIIRIVMNLCILLMVFSVYVGCVFGLFFMTKYFYEYDVFNSLQSLEAFRLEASIPALINVIVLQIFDELYETLSEQLTHNENHQTVNDFEANFIMKKFSLLLLSYFSPIFLITFLSDSFGIDCAFGSCYLHASYYFSSIFIILFLFNIKEVLQPIIRKMLIKQENIEYDYGDSKYTLINKYIEEEASKESYFITVDRYGTVNDYMEIVIQSGLLGLFGSLFPASLFVGFVWNVLEIQTDKSRLIQYTQRPLPLDEYSIGIWNLLIEFLGNACIIYNSGLVYIIAQKYPDPALVGVSLFLLILVTNFFVRFMQEALVSDVSFTLMSIMKRHQYLLKSTIERFKQKDNQLRQQLDEHNNLVRYPMFKPYGTILDNKKKKVNIYADDSYADVSSINEEREQPAQQQQVLMVLEGKHKKSKQKRRTVQCFQFPKRKYESLREQRIYNDKIIKLRKMLAHYECRYALKWCEYRFIQRPFYIRRSLKVLRNLNVVKLKLFVGAYRLLYKKFFAEEALKHQRALVEDLNEKEMYRREQHKVAKRKAKREVRGAVVLKTKGVWFNQFRRQVPIVRSKELIVKLRKKYQEDNKGKRRRGKVQLGQIIITEQVLMKERWRIFDQVNQLEILKISPPELLKLLVKDRDYYQGPAKLKSSIVRYVEQIQSLNSTKISYLQGQIYHQELPSYLQLSQLELKHMFYSINQKNRLKTTSFRLICSIEGNPISKYSNLVQLFKNEQQQQKHQLWLIQQNAQLKLIEITELGLNREFPLKLIRHGDHYLQEYVMMDHFYFQGSQGIVGRIIQPSAEHTLLFGWTLRDTIKMRSGIPMEYTEIELLQILQTMLLSITNQDKQVMTITSIVAQYKDNRVSYQFNWLDYGNRPTSVFNYEFLCCSPELLNNQQSSTNKLYNIGMLMLYLITLGSAFDSIAEVLDKQSITSPNLILQVILDYLVDNQNKLLNQYPIVITIIQDMISSGGHRKPLQYILSLVNAECKENIHFQEKKVFSSHLHQYSQTYKIHPTNFEEIQLYDENEIINAHQAKILHLELAQQLFKLDTLYKFKLLGQLKGELDEVEIIFRQVFKEDYNTHITTKFQYYCDRPQHNKVMFDILNILLYKQLYYVMSHLNLEDLKNSNSYYMILDSYIPNINSEFALIHKIQKYTSNDILEEYDNQHELLIIKKRLRIHQETYLKINQKLDLLLGKFNFIMGFTQMLSQDYQNSYKTLKIISDLPYLSKEQQLVIQYVQVMNLDQQSGQDRSMKIRNSLLQEYDEQLSSYYNMKFAWQQITLLMHLEDNTTALTVLSKMQIKTTECIFGQSCNQLFLTLQSELNWIMNKSQQCYDILHLWMQTYKQTKCFDILIQTIVYLEKCVGLLQYNSDIPLVEDCLYPLLSFDNQIVMVHYICYRLINILNLKVGLITTGMIGKQDTDSMQAERKHINKLVEILPKKQKLKDDFLNALIFEALVVQTHELDLLPYTRDIQKQLVGRRLFIIAKFFFTKKQYQIASKLLHQITSLTTPYHPTVIHSWKFKCAQFLQQFYDMPIHFQDLDWKDFFISLVYDLKTLYGQLVCQVALKLLDSLQMSRVNPQFEQIAYEFKICFVRLLLQEYRDIDNKYIDESFQIKFYILSTLSSQLQELILKLLQQVCDLEDSIHKMELVNYNNPQIQLYIQQTQQANQHVSDLMQIQSQLLEESGDPVAALKCLDIQFAVMLYDQRYQKQVERVFTRKLSSTDPNYAVTKCKVAVFKAFLNPFGFSVAGLQKIQKFSIEQCVAIVNETMDMLGEHIIPSNRVIWDTDVLAMMTQAKPNLMVAFQKYKIIHYQIDLKLLETYALKADFKNAQLQYQLIMNHYMLQNDKHLQALFEYTMGFYNICIWDMEVAQKLLNRALVHLNEPLGNKLLQYDELILNAKPLDAPFRDVFSDIKIENEMLDDLNHLFTLKSRSKILYCQSMIVNQDTYNLFTSIVLTIETIRKTMGRKSILYCEALLVYTAYMLKYREQEQYNEFKLVLKTQYFYSKKDIDYFRPGIYTTQDDNSSFVFYSIEEIEQKFNSLLLTNWIQELLTQAFQFLTEYYEQVNIVDNLQIIECQLQLHRIFFCQGRLFNAKQYIEKALASLERLCPSLEHPQAVQIYRRYAAMCENVERIIQDNINIIVNCQNTSIFNRLTYDEKYMVARAIHRNDEKLTQYFDEFRSNGFEFYLLQKLEEFLKIPANKKKKNRLIVLDQIKIAQLLDKAHHDAIIQDREQKEPYLQTGATGFYRKAFMACRQMFKESNHLYQAVEKKFIELSRQEQRDIIK